jgi:hypothetical protein
MKMKMLNNIFTIILFSFLIVQGTLSIEKCSVMVLNFQVMSEIFKAFY